MHAVVSGNQQAPQPPCALWPTFYLVLHTFWGDTKVNHSRSRQQLWWQAACRCVCSCEVQCKSLYYLHITKTRQRRNTHHWLPRLHSRRGHGSNVLAKHVGAHAIHGQGVVLSR